MVNIETLDITDIPPFEDGGEWQNPFAIGEKWRHFRVGSCTGLYRAGVLNYEILSITNDQPGNGHVEATLAWFFKSCKRDKRNLIVHEVMNDKLSIKLIKMGFTCKISNDYIKRFE